MLDYDKIGKFLQNLRIEKGYSQEQVAEMLFVTRQFVSKWERGKSLPSNEILVSLCKLYDISANEILAGEKKSSENKQEISNIAITVLKDNEVKKKRIIIKFLIIIFLLILVFLGYYFINTFNRTKAYLISGADDKFSFNYGLVLKNNEFIYFDLGLVSNYTDYPIEVLDIYYLKDNEKQPIVQSQSLNVYLHEYKGNHVYFDFDDFYEIINNLYVDVIYDKYNKVSSIKLNFTEVYTNNNLIFKKKQPIFSSSVPYSPVDVEVPKEIMRKFIYNYDEKKYFYKHINNNFTVEMSYEPYSKQFDVKEINDKESKIWSYSCDAEILAFWYDNLKNDDLDYLYTITNGEKTCGMGNCEDSDTSYIYFLENYINYVNN